ncbi:MAG: adenylyltransferase/cytidyltransferase family protein [Deltaproteobacteria bacterium]|nr:adenylyltransferase/cytidyltransferase family protein [Deltaproteobacteria bacterium]
MKAEALRDTDRKILDLKVLGQRIRAIQQGGRTVALCHGVFDLLHVGHLRYFRGASRKADVVVVTATPDRFVDKGPNRPAFPENLRLEALAALEVVDFVSLNRWPTAEETLRLLRPDFYVKGGEFRTPGDDPTGKMELERQAAQEVGCRVEFIDDLVFSSSELLNRHFEIYPPLVSEYLAGLREAHPLGQVLSLVDRIAELRVLVVGDAIIHRYIYVETLGRASKTPSLTTRNLSEARWAGGAVAVANQVAALGCPVELLSLVGNDGEGAFLEQCLAPAAGAHLVERPTSPTVTHARFVDANSGNHLYSVTNQEEVLPASEVEDELLRQAEALTAPEMTGEGQAEDREARFDLVICADYGYGAIPPRLLKALHALPHFIAIRTQAHSNGRGYPMVSRYDRADFACLTEREIRLEAGAPEGELQPLVARLAARLGSSLIAVTRDRAGCLMAARDGAFHEAPWLSSKAIDEDGAEEALFALASLAAAVGASPALASLLASTAQAHTQNLPQDGTQHQPQHQLRHQRSASSRKRPLDGMNLRKQLTAMLK